MRASRLSTISATSCSKLVRWPPAELGARLGRIAEQQVDLGRPEIARVDLDQDAAGRWHRRPVSSTPLPRQTIRAADLGERALDEFAHRVRLAGRQHIIVGLVLLQDQPHAFDIVARMAPVALGVEIAEVERAPAARARWRRPRG